MQIGVGPAATASADLVLDIGEHHPATHGSLRLTVTLDGDRIATADPVIGYLHRGAEKLFEVRDYRQIMVLANRHDWLSAFGNELGVALAVEQMLGMDVPERATWLRTALAELQRILNALMFLSASGGVAFELRERLQDVLEEASGGRMHLMFNRVGGLKEDVPQGWVGRVREALAVLRERLGELAPTGGEGLGVLTREQCEQYGVSGPVARASGLDLDLRRDSPYLAYEQLDLRVVTRAEGDAHARLACLVEQVEVSTDLVEQCLSRLPSGPVNLKLPKTVKAPEAAAYVWTENPLGINGYWIVSRGEKTPWRCKLRTASFNTVQVLSEVLPGLGWKTWQQFWRASSS